MILKAVPVQIKVHSKGMYVNATQYGYVDVSGKTIINPQFNRALDFCEGLAPVQAANLDKWGYIDITGQFVVTPQFILVIPLPAKDIVVFTDSKWAFFDRKKQAIKDDSMWGYIKEIVEWDGMGGWFDKKYLDKNGQIIHQENYWSGIE
jgi:WG containing repeat